MARCASPRHLARQPLGAFPRRYERIPAYLSRSPSRPALAPQHPGNGSGRDGDGNGGSDPWAHHFRSSKPPRAGEIGEVGEVGKVR